MIRFLVAPWPLVLAISIARADPAPGMGESQELGLRVAPGFAIERYADHDLAPDVYSMTLDPDGNVVISSKGYIKRLLDTDGDGRADEQQTIAKSGAGAMGMLFLDATTLLTTEGGNLNRYTDADGDGKIDPLPERIAKFGGGEHGAHAIRRDSTGTVYLIGGNGANFRDHPFVRSGKETVEGGALLRLLPDFSKADVIAQGFRNPYDFDISTRGEVFCYDSDCEREYFLPWYSPTRLYRIEIGSHHGWRLAGYKRGWKRPDYYPDSVRPLVNVGRGSPTGVAVYRHGAFPLRYQEGVFYCDWTFGRVYFTQPDDALLEFGSPQAEVFIESTGTNGFAPTDIEVAPDGSLFISMGGRGTTGSVFRVWAAKMREGAKPAAPGGVFSWLDHIMAASPRLEERALWPEAAEAHARQLDTGLLEDSAEARMISIRELMLELGDWNLHEPSRELFTGYEFAEDKVFAEEHTELRKRCLNALRPLLHSLDDDERREAARLLAMLRDSHPITARRLLGGITEDSAPVEDFHYLICLARIDAPLDEALTKRAAGAILALDGKIAGKQMRSKQTYVDRLVEMVAALAERAAIYEALLADGRLATPNYAGLAKAFPESHGSAIARAYFDAMRASPGAGWREDAVELLAGLPLGETRTLLREIARDPLLARSCAKLLAGQADELDRPLFLSVGDLDGLEKLAPKADAQNLLPLFRAADGKRALKLIGRAAGVGFEDRAAAEAWLREKKPEVASALGLGAGGSKTDWPSRFAKVDWDTGLAERGRALFATRACATCHASANALGPDLSGAARRLSPADLFKAIAMPNADVPEAYRATVFTLKDGTVHIGRVAFMSADGEIVQTAVGTVRIDEGDVARRVGWARSLMPEGLLEGLSLTDLADLHAYLKTF